MRRAHSSEGSSQDQAQKIIESALASLSETPSSDIASCLKGPHVESLFRCWPNDELPKCMSGCFLSTIFNLLMADISNDLIFSELILTFHFFNSTEFSAFKSFWFYRRLLLNKHAIVFDRPQASSTSWSMVERIFCLMPLSNINVFSVFQIRYAFRSSTSVLIRTTYLLFVALRLVQSFFSETFLFVKLIVEWEQFAEFFFPVVFRTFCHIPWTRFNVSGLHWSEWGKDFSRLACNYLSRIGTFGIWWIVALLDIYAILIVHVSFFPFPVSYIAALCYQWRFKQVKHKRSVLYPIPPNLNGIPLEICIQERAQ